MKYRRAKFSFLFAFVLAVQCIAQQPGVVVLNASSKELKRAAHRLRIPVEQLKNARQTLHEATDLAKKLDPCPAEQFFNLAQAWNQLDKNRSKEVLESLVQDLRTEAVNCSDYACYQKVTSVGFSLMQSNQDFDYEALSSMIRNWPDPKGSGMEAARAYKESLEAQAKKQALSRMATSDPEKALAMMADAGDLNLSRYSATAQIAQGLANSGKREQALRLIDESIQKFDPNTADTRSLQDYENLIRTTAMSLDASRASNAMAGLIAAYQNQNQGSCAAATLRSGNTALDLTCAETRILNLVRGVPMRPGFAQKTVEALPGLKSKLDKVGGIDALYGGGQGFSISYGATAAQGSGPVVTNTGSQGIGTESVNIPNLIQDLKGKDAAYARSKLKKLSIDVLITMAMNLAYQDPDTGSIALEIAQQLLPQVEPLQKRASMMQSLVQAYRQVDGETDTSLLKSGFVIADELRQEISEKAMEAVKRNPAVQVGQYGTPQADQLESFLISELARSSYDSAIRYVRSMENSALKLSCMIQMAQVLSQPNF